MSTELVMPKAGITMDEGTVLTWLVQPGEAFREGTPLMVVETDKASVEVNANEAGVLLEILVGEGVTVPVGTPVARIGTADSEPAAALPQAPQPTPLAQAPDLPVVEPAPERHLRISPMARWTAVQLGVDPAKVQGTGPGGRILRRDVEAAHQQASLRPADPVPTGAVVPTPVSVTANAPAVPAAVPAPDTTPAPAPAGAPASGQPLPLSRMRRIIAERLTLSATTIPQFRVNLEVDLSGTLHLQESLRPLKVQVSLTDFVVQACAQTLAEYPQVNASFLPGEGGNPGAIVQHAQVNLGLAVALEDGLAVPVIHGAESLSLLEIAQRRRTVGESARAGRLTPDQLFGGTFTLSNLGPYGIDSFDAIVNPPEAAILAVGQVVRKPVVNAAGEVEVRPMLALTLTSDHRVLDGALAARFLRSLGNRLERADQFRLA